MKKSNSIIDSIRDIFGNEVDIASRTPVSGGDINSAYALKLTNGESLFLKENEGGLSDMFYCEGRGLMDIASTGAIKCPTPLAYGVDAESKSSFLILSHIQSARQMAGYWREFGRALANMHLARAYEPSEAEGDLIYGAGSDNYIGYTRQDNTPTASWVDFFRDHRLRPQFEMAYGRYRRELYDAGEALMENLGRFLQEPERPSILHGDLWSGNAMPGDDGSAWLIDPASYVGHNEVDLAMTQLFGSFPGDFYSGYNEVFPISDDFETHKEVYNLYQLLNHLNMFGSGYLPSVMRILAGLR